MRPTARYRPSLALATDLYELTMAYAHHREGTASREASFSLSFRKTPFGGGYAIACGLAEAIDVLEGLSFTGDDCAYLATLTGADGKPLFDAEFLERLRAFSFSCDVDAIPEGTAVFAHEPLVRVTGPLLEAQIVESVLLNLISHQTLIATKASRVVTAARGAEVLEFGLRRAQGLDGAISASRAAFVGGCHATSNVLAGRLFGIPVRGTHAHSWVMSFEDEKQAFLAYADALPANCVFLVDTYDTLRGVQHAVEVGRTLRERGHELLGVRLDSGDLTYLSQEARRILDAGGFPNAKIVASNDLDERLVESLHHQGARIDQFGVGTQLVTAFDQPSLGCVYKLTAMKSEDGRWLPRVKRSEQAVKSSNPGVISARRYRDGGLFVADVIFDVEEPLGEGCTIVDPSDPSRTKTIPAGMPHEELLVPVLRRGVRVYDPPTLAASRERTLVQLSMLHPGIKRLDNPHVYPAGLSLSLHERKMRMLRETRAR